MNINKDLLNNKNTSRGTNKCIYLVLHHTGVIGEGNIRILSGNGSQVSVHYLVMLDGRIFQFVDENKIAWHCGVSRYNGISGLNNYAIGIEIESDGKQYTDIQKQKVKELTNDIISRQHIGVENIIRHLDIAGFRGKRDVSDAFRNNEYKTFTDYQNSFSNPKPIEKMYNFTEDDKKIDIETLMTMSSALHKKVSNTKKLIGTTDIQLSLDKLQKQLASVNKMFREMGFDN